MWLAPHFMALDVAGASMLLFQNRKGISIYQRQSDPCSTGAAPRPPALRQRRDLLARRGRQALMRAIRRGDAFFNLPDMDFGTRDAAFVPFFGVQAVTLLAPSRMARALDMVVQPVVAEILPAAAGYLVPLRGAVERLPERRPGRRQRADEPLDRGRDPAQSGAVPLGAIAASRRGRRASRRCTDNPSMRLRFTKMQGAGNDFVVLDATRAPLALDARKLRRIGDRRFGVGCDQILIVEPSTAPGVDFRYRIFNGASGDEVEQCGNGARCFVRFVRARGLSDKKTLVVETMNRRLELREQGDGRVTVDMGAPDFEPLHVPFDTTGLAPRSVESGCRSGRSSWARAQRRAGGRLDGQPARGAGRRRRRCRAGRDRRAAARAPRSLRARRQRRLHAGRRPRRRPPARLRARRRRDARLRHRRLRRGRRRHSPRPARRARSTSRRAAAASRSNGRAKARRCS
jgi:hypothetical protein